MTVTEESTTLESARPLDAHARELSFLHQTSQMLTATLDSDDILQALMKQVRDYFQAEAVSVALLDGDGRDLVFRVAVGGPSEAVTDLRLPLDTGIAGWVTREGKSVFIPNVDQDSRFHPGVDEMTGFRTRAVLAAPIQTDQGAIGAIQALNPAAGKDEEQQLRVLERLANQVALALRNAARYERARQASLRYERLFHCAPVPIFVMDLDTRILDVNHTGAELLGKSEDELIGSRWSDLYDNQDACEPVFGELPEEGKASGELTVPTPTGPRTLSVRMTSIEYQGQRAIQWTGHDITELAEVERMRDDLMHMVVHDLQNPLSNIVGSLEIMCRAIEHGEDGIPLTDVLQVATQSSNRLQRLIRSLLDLRQLEDGRADLDRRQVRAQTLAREAIDVVRPVIDKKCQTLTVNIPPDLLSLVVDRDMITRVLTNLLDNAAKFTPKDGEIGLTIEQEGPGLLFTISDNGPGIPPDAQACVFERYTRLEAARKIKGTGLGLPFCKLAVEAHGGEISVESTPGEGSRFIFSLPARTE